LAADRINYVAIGALGGGFSLDSLQAGIARGADFIGVDAGSSDMGAYALAGQGGAFPKASLQRDLEEILIAARKAGLPVIIGSCGLAGTRQGVDAFARIARETARKAALPMRIARIYADVDRDWLKAKLRADALRPLVPAFDYDEVAIDRSIAIVGVMGVEPIRAALEAGADVVLAGRASDTAIFAAMPLLRGMDEGSAWLAAKTAECGAAAATPPRTDCLYVSVGGGDFTVEALAPDLTCTPASVAAHQLYESANPFLRTEPSGVIDASEACYAEARPGVVRVTGARFRPAERYTVKLEGAELAGHQHVVMLSIRDPDVVQRFEEWRATAEPVIARRIAQVYRGGAPAPYDVNLRVYGRDGTMGAWEHLRDPVSHELFLLIDVVSPDRDLSANVASIIWYVYIHHAPFTAGYPTLAWPYNPHIIDRGQVHRFNVNHVVEIDDPLEMFPIELEDAA
jgi:hypothetical protein